MIRSHFILPSLALAVLLVGCGEAEVPKADVEKSAMEQLSATVGQESPPITCPGNLPAKVGATLICAIDLDGQTHDVTIKVTSVDGSTANYDVEVAETPRS